MATTLQITCGNESIKGTTVFSFSNPRLGQGTMLSYHTATNWSHVRGGGLILNMSRHLDWLKAAAHLMETEHGFKHVLHEQLLQTLWREAEQHYHLSTQYPLSY